VTAATVVATTPALVAVGNFNPHQAGSHQKGFSHPAKVSGNPDTFLSKAYLNMADSAKLPSVLAAQPEDIQLMLAAQCHIGTKNCDKSMENYVWKRRADGEF
jgi:hypothetical protein